MRKLLTCVLIFASVICLCACGKTRTKQATPGEIEQIEEIAEKEKELVCSTVEAAEAIAGFEIDLPEHPGGFDYPEITAVQSQRISVCFYDMKDMDSAKARWYRFEKALDADELTAQALSYPDSSTETIKGIDYACQGKDGFIYVVNWERNGYAYRMTTNTGCLAAELPELLEGMR